MNRPRNSGQLPPGLYDSLLDEALSRQAAELAPSRLKPDIGPVDPAEIPDRVGEFIGFWIKQVIASQSPADRAQAAASLSRALLNAVTTLFPDSPQAQLLVRQEIQRLMAVESLSPTGDTIQLERPHTPLRDTVLMTNARGQPSLAKEIAAEIDSADRIDIIVAFVRWSGIRQIRDRLRRHIQDGNPSE